MESPIRSVQVIWTELYTIQSDQHRQPHNTSKVSGVSVKHCDQKGMHKCYILCNAHKFWKDVTYISIPRNVLNKMNCKILQINTNQINKWKWCFVFRNWKKSDELMCIGNNHQSVNVPHGLTVLLRVVLLLTNIILLSNNTLKVIIQFFRNIFFLKNSFFLCMWLIGFCFIFFPLYCYISLW